MMSLLKSFLPKRVVDAIRPPYHFLLSFLAALIYRFPSKRIFVIGVTGTKGKSTTVELASAMLKTAGHRVASTSTIRFSIGNKTQENRYKMTMPGRFFIHSFLSEAARSGCTHAVLEMTSEGARQYRHCFVDMDTLIFLNLSPEHIESHGSYENYKKAKLSLARSLERSKKPIRTIIANADDCESDDFLDVDVDRKMTFSLEDLNRYTETEEGLSFLYKEEHIVSSLRGRFNASNICAVLRLSESLDIPLSVPKRAVALTDKVEGRVEEVRISKEQPFSVYVDYAHTPDSLQKLYDAFKKERTVCVLGCAGGGRDSWKRPEMGAVAERYCEHIILTNEDPYDEVPEKIVADIASGIKEKKPETVMDRRLAIRTSFKKALELSRGEGRVSVLITGKGTDPYIMGPKGKRTPWSDVRVVIEELRKEIGGWV